MASRLVVLVVAVLTAAGAAAELEKYSTKFDYLNVDQILKNNRLVKSYYNCLVDLGPCTQEGFEFRSTCFTVFELIFCCSKKTCVSETLPDALKTRCRKCNSLQKKNARKVIEYIMKNKPDMWQGVLKKYDPTGVLTKNLFADDFLG